MRRANSPRPVNLRSPHDSNGFRLRRTASNLSFSARAKRHADSLVDADGRHVRVDPQRRGGIVVSEDAIRSPHAHRPRPRRLTDGAHPARTRCGRHARASQRCRQPAHLVQLRRGPRRPRRACLDRHRRRRLRQRARLAGIPWARIGEHVGQRNLAVTANTYSHVLADETELDYAELLAVG
jgi:hypothetical protein